MVLKAEHILEEFNIKSKNLKDVPDMLDIDDETEKQIMEKAKKAVEKVAKAQGYQYVLDSATGGGVIFADGKDLFNDVKKELGF